MLQIGGKQLHAGNGREHRDDRGPEEPGRFDAGDFRTRKGSHGPGDDQTGDCHDQHHDEAGSQRGPLDQFTVERSGQGPETLVPFPNPRLDQGNSDSGYRHRIFGGN